MGFKVAGLVAASLVLTACQPAAVNQASNTASIDTTITASPSTLNVDTQEPAGSGESVNAVAEERYSATYHRCLESGDAAEGVTLAMHECMAAELQIQDAQLNARYKHAMSAMDDAGTFGDALPDGVSDQVREGDAFPGWRVKNAAPLRGVGL